MLALPELAQLELLAQVDELLAQLRDWIATETGWKPLRQGQALVRRLLSRAEALRIRLEAPLVVATFGGTGTGKSALINALIGAECTASGRQRPTTRRPILIAHPLTPLEPLQLPLNDLDVLWIESPVLRDLVLLDCPDPDTNEAAEAQTNLARLRRLIPHCDVLLYTSTQQKYRSARVREELSHAAAGCRLVFVQTHADLDSDIRADWRQQLGTAYEVPDVFFVDSLRALQEQQAGQRPSGDFGRLLDLLSGELGSAQRMRVRRANLLDLLFAALDHTRGQLASRINALDTLDQALAEQRQQLLEKMASQLRGELLTSRQLWERRLLGAVTEHWGLSPFCAVLRVYHGLGALLASAGLSRARSAAQLAVLGAIQGARWWQQRSAEALAHDRLDQLSTLGLDESTLRETQLVLTGSLQQAELEIPASRIVSTESLRQHAVGIEGRFLEDAGQQVEQLIQRLAARHSRWYRRICYEVMWLAFVGYLIGRVGKNFFWDSIVLQQPILTVDFYIAASGFLALWAGLLLMLFLRGLRRGLGAEVEQLAQRLAHSRVGTSLFPEWERAVAQARQQTQQLAQLQQQIQTLRREVAQVPGLGNLRAPSASELPLETPPQIRESPNPA